MKGVCCVPTTGEIKRFHERVPQHEDNIDNCIEFLGAARKWGGD